MGTWLCTKMFNLGGMGLGDYRMMRSDEERRGVGLRG